MLAPRDDEAARREQELGQGEGGLVSPTRAPLVEDTRDPKGRLLVTFVYRAKPDTRAVALYSAPGGIHSYARLERLAGTDVFAYSALVEASARFPRQHCESCKPEGDPRARSHVERRAGIHAFGLTGN